MARIGYHASHEQYSPRELLRLVQMADRAGFQSGMCSDHFHPWGEHQGHSGFAWSWLGAALQATSLSFGVVTVPGGWRYNPAIVAQAAATLAQMFPGRFWIAPGSGELLNEGITGERWPIKSERNARLREACDVIRALWTGERVTHRGLVTVEEARIYDLPEVPPKIVGAALSPETAEFVGGWADGMITVVGPRESMQEIVDAFRRGGGEGKPIFLQAQLSYAKTEEEALHGAWEQWRTVKLPSPVLSDLRLPSQFDALGEGLRKEEVKEKMRVAADVEQHLEWLAGDVEMGFEEVNLHCVHREQQERFIEVFGERVIPQLAGR